MNTDIAIPVSTALLAASTLTGIAVQSGLVDTSRIRWIHHALYAGCVLSWSLAVVAAVRATRHSSQDRAIHPRPIEMLPAGGALLLLARTGGGTRAHAVTAGFAVVLHVLGVGYGRRSWI